MPHVIRLRAPWEIEPLAETPGHIRCTRHFNKPTGLGDGERVWLVLSSLDSPATILLNGVLVGTAFGLPADDGPDRFDITPRLESRNKVEIHMSANSDAAAAILEQVRLEIE